MAFPSLLIPCQQPATREKEMPGGAMHDASDDTLKEVRGREGPPFTPSLQVLDIPSATSSISDVNADDGPLTQEQTTLTEGPADGAPNPPFGSISETDANQEKKVSTKRIQANGALADSLQ